MNNTYLTPVKSLIIVSGVVLLLAGTILHIQAQEHAGQWNQFRGPELDGICTQPLPVRWDDSTHIAWKSPIPGKGWSSPVVWEDQVWITTALEKEKELKAICVDLKSGHVLKEITVFTSDTLYRKHSVNSYATPTPAIEAGFLYVHFGRYGTACLNTTTGQKVWERTDLHCDHVQGPGSSVILHGDKLIVHMEGTDVQYITALDKQTGETIWRTGRPQELYEPLEEIGRKAYVTPLIISVNGKDLLISNGSAVCVAYEVETGREVWRIIQGEDSTIAMPVECDGWVYFYTSFVTGENEKRYAELFAVDPQGEGDIGNTHVKWRMESPILQLSSPVAMDGKLYTVNSQSTLQCIDARSGKVFWEERLRGKFHSSPIYASGLLYFSSTRGETIVCRAGDRYEELALNRLKGEIWATPAAAEGSILMRTSNYLYRIQNPETACLRPSAEPPALQVHD